MFSQNVETYKEARQHLNEGVFSPPLDHCVGPLIFGAGLEALLKARVDSQKTIPMIC